MDFTATKCSRARLPNRNHNPINELSMEVFSTITVPAPIKAADTIQKLFFEVKSAATIQERLLFRKYPLSIPLYGFKLKSTFLIINDWRIEEHLDIPIL